MVGAGKPGRRAPASALCTAAVVGVGRPRLVWRRGVAPALLPMPCVVCAWARGWWVYEHLWFGPVDGGGGWRRPPSPCEAARGSTGAPACAVYRARVSARVVGVCARARVSVRACVPRSPPRLSSQSAVAAPRLRSSLSSFQPHSGHGDTSLEQFGLSGPAVCFFVSIFAFFVLLPMIISSLHSLVWSSILIHIWSG